MVLSIKYSDDNNHTTTGPQLRISATCSEVKFRSGEIIIVTGLEYYNIRKVES